MTAEGRGSSTSEVGRRELHALLRGVLAPGIKRKDLTADQRRWMSLLVSRGSDLDQRGWAFSDGPADRLRWVWLPSARICADDSGGVEVTRVTVNGAGMLVDCVGDALPESSRTIPEDCDWDGLVQDLEDFRAGAAVPLIRPAPAVYLLVWEDILTARVRMKGQRGNDPDGWIRVERDDDGLLLAAHLYAHAADVSARRYVSAFRTLREAVTFLHTSFPIIEVGVTVANILNVRIATDAERHSYLMADQHAYFHPRRYDWRVHQKILIPRKP